MHTLQLKDPALLRHQAYIDGQWCDASNGQHLTVYNPATQAPLVQVADIQEDQTIQAIEAAHRAFSQWSALLPARRARLLRKWFELIRVHTEDLAYILTAEQGKPLREAVGEIRYGASFVEWYAEEARRIYGDIIPPHTQGVRLAVIKQPIGVVAAITPWNFPNAMITRKVAPALAAGCTVVVKPAEDTPLSALALAVLAERAGFPAGVFNVIPTSQPQRVGQVLTHHELVRKLSFTGSTEVGKQLMRQCADTVKKVSLELGGNAPFIVFDDADLEAAVQGTLASKYRNTGQTCICANRIFVQDSVYEAFAKKFAQAVQQLKVGVGTDPDTDLGPLINRAALEKVERLIADATARGACMLTGGPHPELGGTFYTPTVLTDVTPDMAIAQEEIFGPIAPLYRFRTEEEVVQMANDTHYGLAAYFYGRDIGRVWRVAEALEYGMVGINTGMISTAVAPFGGVKQSGIGREGSKYGIDEFVVLKYLCFGGINT